MNTEFKQKHPVILRAFQNGNVVNTFLVIKDFDIPKAAKIVVECLDSNGNLLQAEEINNWRGSGLLTYNDTINTPNHTLRSARVIRDDIIARYNIQVEQELKAFLKVFENNVHLFVIEIPNQ